MADWDTLCTVAYAAERVRARRLARGNAISEHAALLDVLRDSAAGLPLAQLIAARQTEQQRALDRRSERLQKKTLWKDNAARAAAPDGVHWQAWFDGSAEPNPGRIGLGGVLCDPTGGRRCMSLRGDHGDSNQAEYAALIGVLEYACQQRATPLILHGDSKIVMEDLQGIALVPMLRAYRQRAHALLTQLSSVDCRWVPRHKNQLADQLARAARGTFRETEL